MSLIGLLGRKSAVQTYSGIEGIKEVYEKTLESKGPIYGYTDLEAMGALLGEEWIWSYAQQRADKDIFFHCLAKVGPLAAKAQVRAKEDKRELKFLGGIVSGLEMYILENEVVILDFENACGFIINDSTFAKNQMAIWKYLWDIPHRAE